MVGCTRRRAKGSFYCTPHKVDREIRGLDYYWRLGVYSVFVGCMLLLS